MSRLERAILSAFSRRSGAMGLLAGRDVHQGKAQKIRTRFPIVDKTLAEIAADRRPYYLRATRA